MNYGILCFFGLFLFRGHSDAHAGGTLVLCFFYNDMQVFKIKAVALFGDAIELLDDPTVDGGGFGIGLQMEVFKKVVKVGGAIDKVFVVADLLKRFHHFVVFVPDLADKLFDDVLQRDDALGAAELIHDDGKVRFVLLQKL